MNLILWLVFGAFAGFIANKLDPIPARGGTLGAVVFGLVGALVGGILASILFGSSISGFDVILFIIAIASTLLFLLIQRTVLTRG